MDLAGLRTFAAVVDAGSLTRAARLTRQSLASVSRQLRALEDDDLVIRKVYAEVPPRVEYTLSDIGESLRPVIETLRAWGEGHQERLSCAPDAVETPDRAA